MSTLDDEQEPPSTKMVLSGYHFKSQSIFAVGCEPVAMCVAGEKLLVATVGHTVEVRNLDAHGRHDHSFCTVDLVKQMLHSEIGQYIATLEVKASRQNLMTFIRLYFNWQVDTSALPMRARIAGRVTPSSQTALGQLEMVELPLQKKACYIGCCKSTGNLAVSCCVSVSIFNFCIKIHDISRLQFHDMEHLMEVYYTFPIKEVALCEDFLACMSASEIHVIRLDFRSSSNSQNSAKNISRSASSQAFTRPKMVPESGRRASVPTDEPSELVRDQYFISWNCSAATRQNWGLTSSENDYLQDLKIKLHHDSWPLTIHLPSLLQQTVYIDQLNLPREITGPLDFFPGHPVKVEYTGVLGHTCDRVIHFDTVSLLYKRFAVPLPCTNQQFCLHSLQFSPFYIADSVQSNGSGNRFKDDYQGPILQTSFSDSGNPLQSQRHNQLKHLEVFFSGPNEGFLFNLLGEVQSVASYPFTCTVQYVALENNVLHAISPNGIETYSLGHWQRILKHFKNSSDIEKLIWSSSKDQTVLLGMHQFLNINLATYQDGHLILLANANDNALSSSEESTSGILTWTAYALQCPPAEYFYMDLLENNINLNSENQRDDVRMSKNTELYIMHEAQAVLAAEVLLNQPPFTSHISQLFQDACFQLGNIYLKSEHERVSTALAFYKMPNCSIECILQKLFFTEPKLLVNPKRMCNFLSLIFILNGLSCNSSKDKLIKKLANAVVDVFASEGSDQFSKLFLCGHLSGYDSDVALKHIQNRIASKQCNAEDVIAACILCVQCGFHDQIPSYLISLTNEFLLDLTTKYPSIWVDNNKGGITFSSLFQVVQHLKPNIFTKILNQLLINGHLDVNFVPLFCQGDWEEFELASRTDSLLMLFLEELLMNKLSKPWHCFEAIITLSTLYLKCLANVDTKIVLPNQPKPWSLFGVRRSWLNDLPPFIGQSFHNACKEMTDSTYNVCQEREVLIKELCPCLACNDCLLRLQCLDCNKSLLCSDLASIEVRSRIAVAIRSAPSVRGALSLQVLCSMSTLEAAHIIIVNYPSALLEYCRDMFGADASQWQKLLRDLLDKIEPDNIDNNEQLLLNASINAIVAYLAEIVTPTELITMLPKKENAKFLPHVKRCIAKHQAKNLRDIIIAKGFELKSIV